MMNNKFIRPIQNLIANYNAYEKKSYIKLKSWSPKIAIHTLCTVNGIMVL